jgi:GGDEF domain-containing protein
METMRDILPSVRHLGSIAAVQERIADSEVELPDALRMLLECAQQLTGAEGAALELAEGTDLVWVAATGSLEGDLGKIVDMAEDPSAACFASGRPVFSEVPAMVCVPVFLAGRTVGVLKLSTSSPGAFGDEQVATATALSRVITSAMDRTIRLEGNETSSPVDPLTGLETKEHYDRHLAEALTFATHTGLPLSLVVIHLSGYFDSQLVRKIANLIRAVDTCFLIDGGEFAIVMPNTPIGGARIAAFRISDNLAQEDKSIRVTVGAAQATSADPLELQMAALKSMETPHDMKKQSMDTPREPNLPQPPPPPPS